MPACCERRDGGLTPLLFDSKEMHMVGANTALFDLSLRCRSEI